MSYSFSVRGVTRSELVEKVSAELDKVVATQPIHSADCKQALAAAEAFIAILPDPNDKQDFCVSVSGSLSWSGNMGASDQVLVSASVNVSASLQAKQ